MGRMLDVISTEAVERRLGVSRTAVSTWRSQPEPPLHRIREVRQILLDALADNREAASPNYWVRRLREDVDAISDLLEELAEKRVADEASADAERPQPPDAGTAADPEANDLADASRSGRRGR